MKRKTLPLIVFTLVLFSSAFGAQQIGTVTASGTFELAGTQVPASAAHSTPLMNGDEIKSTTSTAIIMLDDGSRIAVDNNSTLRPRRLGEETLLCLEKGALRFNAAEGSQLVVCALARRIELQAPSEGTVSIKGPDEVLANVEKGAPVVVIEDATCTCGQEKTVPALTKAKGPFLTGTKAIVIVTAGVATAGIGIAVSGEDQQSFSPRSPIVP